MRRVILALLALAALAFAGASSTLATQGDDHKVAICHRTASDTNPYVYIEVDVASLSPGHLDNADPGHKPTYWKSDGIWRGVPHLDGDAKDDYLATSEADCDDLVIVSPSPTPSDDATPSPSPSFVECPGVEIQIPEATECPSESASPSPESSIGTAETATPRPSIREEVPNTAMTAPGVINGLLFIFGLLFLSAAFTMAVSLAYQRVTRR